MDRKITRRDFLDGAAMAIGGVALRLHISDIFIESVEGMARAF